MGRVYRKFSNGVCSLALLGFLTAEAANVAMIYGLAMMPIMASAGVGVDLSRALLVRARLSQALDAAGLAVGAAVAVPVEDLPALAQRFFEANYPEDEIGIPGNLSVSVTGSVIHLSATAELNTTLMAIIGIDTMSVGAASEITRESKGLEVVMVLDVTGSMGSNGKLEAMQDAATDLVEILFGENETSEKLAIGMVPFAGSVRLNPEMAVTGGWIDTTGDAALARVNFDNSVANNYAYAIYDTPTGDGYFDNTAWLGCVEARGNGLEELDTAPTTADTRWVPFFAPDNQSSVGFPNSYTGDNGNYGTTTERQRRTSKYVGRTENGWGQFQTGPQRMCAGVEVLPLVNEKTVVLDRIDDLIANGYTHIPLGIAWGWRVLSPTEPFTEGKAYDDPENNKAIIILTDGLNTMPDDGMWGSYDVNRSEYTAFGYAVEERMGAGINWPNEMVDEMDDMITRMCNRIKDENVRIYTIMFQLNDDNLEDIFQDCASEPQLYFNSPTNEDLQVAFHTIAQDLSNLRVSK